MKKYIKSILAMAAGFVISAALPLAAHAQTQQNTTTYTVTPWTYVGAAGDCGTGTAAGSNTFGEGANVVSRWVNDMGNPGPSLYLQKFAPTSDCSSAGATINGVAGITLSELNFDYNSTDTNAHCGAGAPRFNVVTSDNVVHFFGCSAGTTSDAGNGWTHVVFDPTNSSQAFPVVDANVSVTSIDIVMDEQGYAHLDNISVNNQTVGRGNTPWNKNDCKNNGYKNFSDNSGATFKNQGQCVSYVEHNQHTQILSTKNNSAKVKAINATQGQNLTTTSTTNSTTNSTGGDNTGAPNSQY